MIADAIMIGDGVTIHRGLCTVPKRSPTQLRIFSNHDRYF